MNKFLKSSIKKTSHFLKSYIHEMKKATRIILKKIHLYGWLLIIKKYIKHWSLKIAHSLNRWLSKIGKCFKKNPSHFIFPIIFFITAGITIPLIFTYIKTPKPATIKSAAKNDVYAYQGGNQLYSFKIGEKSTNKPTVEFQTTDKAQITFSLITDQEKLDKPIKDGNKITYSNILQSTDITYETLPNGIKEEIILNQRTTTNTYVFSLNLKGTEASYITDKHLSPIFYDAAGNYLFHFEKPFAYDAAGNRTEDVLIQLQKQQDNQSYQARLVVDHDWLTSPDRLFPVVIDPTIIHDTTSEFSSGTFNRNKDTGQGSLPSIETTYQELAADKNTIGLWHLNETSGTLADSSGNGNTGTATNTTYNATSPKLGAASQTFNGSSSKIALAASTNANVTGDISIEMWINPISFAAAGTPIHKDSQFTFQIDTSGYVAWADSSNWSYVNFGSQNIGLQTGVWQHLAFTKSGGVVKIYLNGEEKYSKLFGSAITGTSNVMHIGCYSGAAACSSAYFNGGLDEIRISNIARSPEEIKTSAQRRHYSIYTSPVIDLTGDVASWESFSWNEWGVATGDGETAASSNGLVAQWNFNETSGTTADNAEGTAALDGSLSGFDSTASQDADPDSSWTTYRKWGAGALTFDGTDSHVSVTDNNALDLTTGGTVELWFNRRAIQNYQMLVTKGNGANPGGYQMMDRSTDGRIVWRWAQDSDTIVSKTYVPNGVWTHVVGTYDGSTIKIYINGKLDNSSGWSTTATANALPLRIGSRSDGYYYNGTIDAVRIYNRAISASEVMSHYNASNVELQTRVGTDSSPDDGNWDAWAPTTGETSIESMETALESATRVYTTQITDFGTDQTWHKMSNAVPSNSNTTSTLGRIPLGSSGGDNTHAIMPNVILDGSTYKMWYVGHDGTNYRIYYATSSDGVNWTKYNNTVEAASDTTGTNGRIPLGTNGTGDDTHAGYHTVIKDGSTYKMWYSGHDGTNWRIYYATSSDGLTWTKYNNTIESASNTTGTNGRIPLGSSGGDTNGVIRPSVIKDGSTYKMWYSGADGTNWRTYYATSSDGLTWTKYNNAIPSASNHVGTDGRIPLGGTGSADVSHAYEPTVIKDGDVYKMWYNMHNGTVRTGYATSQNGLTWVKQNNAIPNASDTTGTEGRLPIGNTGTGDDVHSYSPSVLKIGNIYKLWYSGSDGTNYRIYHATMTPTPVTNTLDATIKQEGSYSQVLTTSRLQVDNSTVGLWHLDETGGSSAYLKDSTSNANNGTPTGTSLIDGVSSKGRGFNGTSSDYIEITDNNSLDLTSSFTFEAWLKRNADSGTYERIVSKSDATSYDYWMQINNDDTLNCGLLKGDANQYYRSSAATIPLGVWVHVSCTFDTTSGMFIYINGQASPGTISGTIGAARTSTRNLNFGRLGSGGSFNYSLNAYLDEVRISNVARTSDEIAEIYRAGAGHYLNKNISSTDLSTKSHLPFYVAADRPGTYLSATVGESAFANYQTDSNTAGLWHLEEIQSQDLAIRDSSGSKHHGVAGGLFNHTFESGIETWAVRDGNWGTPTQSCATSAINSCSIYAVDSDGNAGSINVSRATSFSSTTTKVSTHYRCDASARWGMMMFNGTTWYCAQGSGTTGCGSAYTAAGSFSPAITCDGTWRYAEYDMGAGISGQTFTQVIIGDWNAADATNAGKYMYFDNFQLYQARPEPTTGILGKARSFSGTNNDYITVGNGSLLPQSGDITLDAWFKTTDNGNSITIMNHGTTSDWIYAFTKNASNQLNCKFYQAASGSGYIETASTNTINDGRWHHGACVLSGTTLTVYVDGRLVASTSTTTGTRDTSTAGPFSIGRFNWSSTLNWNGQLDEVRVSNTARTADQIRQTYEAGKRSHSVTVDFAAKLDSGNLITGSGDTSFTVDATYYGLQSKGDKLYPGDKIIVRENYDGAEYITQATVTAVNSSTGAVTVTSWDSGGTFPSGGYTANASVFKWQREYWPINDNTLSSHMDGITTLSLRLTDGAEGRTIWLDDLKSNSAYLTNPGGSSITSSTGNQYIQYRAILTSLDPAVSATLSAITLDTQSIPAIPSLDTPTDTATNQSLTPALLTTTTDAESDYLRYKIDLCENLAMTTNCQTFDQTSSQTGWSGQDAQTSTAYISGSQATYTIQTGSELSPATTYYWRTYGTDPGGSNTWGSTQTTPYSFTTTATPSGPGTPYAEGATNPSGIIDLTPELSAIHSDTDGDPAVYYQIQVNTQNDFLGTNMWDSTKTSMASLASGVRSTNVSYAGTALSYNGATYYWRIKFWDDIGAEGAWSTIQNFSMNNIPGTPTLDSPSDTATGVSITPALKTTATDADSDYLQYKIDLCENVGMSTNCQTFDQTSSQTGWSGQTENGNTSYTSGAQANYTIQTPLSTDKTYYWRSYALDPAGTNTFGATQGTPYSFTTAVTSANSCSIQEAPDDSYLNINWTDVSSGEAGYDLQRSVNGGAFSTYQTLGANTTTYQDTGISAGNTYAYKVASYIAGPIYSQYCTTDAVDLGNSTQDIEFKGLNMQGITIQ